MIQTNVTDTKDAIVQVSKAKKEAGGFNTPKCSSHNFFFVTFINTFLKTEGCVRERKERE